ncbi:AraC family transcriptional regulator [Kribbella sp. NBC_01245]|uniref:AraC family transcriptional regulator n=1 Tax=Kribbella sp. NBC_01245 TaxID=2903578 RepID=UPI002E2CA8B4|nr:AraC family transcriptional regulator [Kribbella sp. NBC_01245]
MLLQRLEDDLVVEHLHLPPSPDQLVVLVTAGCAWMESKSGATWRGSRYVRGQIGMTAPGRPTNLRWRATIPTETLHVYLPGGLMRTVAADLWGADSALPGADTLAVADPVLAQVVLALADAAAAGIDDQYAEAAAHFLAVHLQTRHGGRPDPLAPGKEDARVRRAIEIMRDNLHEPLTLADIAGEVWLSVYHFLRVFKAATGQTPRRYLTSLRVQAARKHLESDNASISQIAALCGFSSPSHFAAAFTRELGQSPTNYRRSHLRRT